MYTNIFGPCSDQDILQRMLTYHLSLFLYKGSKRGNIFDTHRKCHKVHNHFYQL